MYLINAVDQAAQDKVRDKAAGRGLLYPDTFSEERLTFLPPGASALLVLFSRNHNVNSPLTELKRSLTLSIVSILPSESSRSTSEKSGLTRLPLTKRSVLSKMKKSSRPPDSSSTRFRFPLAFSSCLDMFFLDQLWPLYEFHHGRLRCWLSWIVRGM